MDSKALSTKEMMDIYRKSLSQQEWMKIYIGRKCDVAGTLDEQNRPIFQTISKDGILTGWRYGDDLEQAKKAADNDGK
ncbi:hypothetical protein [Desulfocastanea catecholica]